MPEDEYQWFPRAALLSFEEIERLAAVFAGLGVDAVRITGGEPLLRRDLDRLVAGFVRQGLDEIALTTNGVLLADHAERLKLAGLTRITVSLDTMRRDRFLKLTRRDDLERTLAGLRAARAAGFTSTKINTVVMRGFNDDELPALLTLGRELGVEVRFIEYMDVGGATRWAMDRVVPREEILRSIAASHGEPIEVPRVDAAPADRFELPCGTRFGIIASTTRPFCGTCDRARLTADGRLFLCLYATTGFDLRDVLRSDASDEELASKLREIWCGRNDRGAEVRLAQEQRTALTDKAGLDDNPHLEMHTRGG